MSAVLGSVRDRPREIALVTWMALDELRHRKALTVVSIITVLLLGLYAWGAFEIIGSAVEQAGRQPGRRFADPVEETKRGAGFLMLGVAVFVTFFLSSVLAVFTTMNAVKGDAEHGQLQAWLVRPLAGSSVVLGRVLAATIAGGGYAALLVLGTSAITTAAGGTAPGNLPAVIAALVLAVAIVASLGVALSTFFAGAATGMATMMLLSLGFFASLVKQIAEAIDSPDVVSWADRATLLLGFNALYEAALGSLTDGVGGLLGFTLQLGPFGQQRDFSTGLVALAAIEIALLVTLAAWRLRRLDL